MCVIFIADRTRPTVDMVEKAFDRNNEGGGIAWREKGVVRWAKDLDLEQMVSMTQKLPMPYVAHFRKESTGGVCPELTHPFLADVTSPLDLHGSTKGFVMFHNGTWHTWKDKLLDTAIKSGVKLPGGKWSDSRAMAFCVAVYGNGVLDIIDERAVLFSIDKCELYGKGWVRVNDVAMSNRLWEDIKNPTRVAGESKVEDSSATNAKKEEGKAGGTSPEATFRSDEEASRRRESKSEGTKTRSQEVRGGHGRDSERATPPVSQKAIEDIEWVRNQNPSPFRRPLRHHSLDDHSDYSEYGPH